jgi:hypothetical protein
LAALLAAGTRLELSLGACDWRSLGPLWPSDPSWPSPCSTKPSPLLARCRCNHVLFWVHNSPSV